jgi:hypothetical protein
MATAKEIIIMIEAVSSRLAEIGHDIEEVEYEIRMGGLPKPAQDGLRHRLRVVKEEAARIGKV